MHLRVAFGKGSAEQVDWLRKGGQLALLFDHIYRKV